MTSTQRLVTELATALPDFRVIGYVAALDQVPRPTVIVWTENLTRTTLLGQDRVLVELRVQVVVGQQEPEEADAPLWEATSQVLEALAPLGWLDWTTAEWVVRADTFHAYTLSLTALATIGE